MPRLRFRAIQREVSTEKVRLSIKGSADQKKSEIWGLDVVQESAFEEYIVQKRANNQRRPGLVQVLVNTMLLLYFGVWRMLLQMSSVI